MARKPMSPAEKALRDRIGAYLRRQWERFAEDRPLATQREFAGALEVHESTVSKVLADQTDAGLDVMLALHSVFGVAPENLMKIDPPKKYFEAVKTDGRARRQVAIKRERDKRNGSPEAAAPDLPPRTAARRQGSSR